MQKNHIRLAASSLEDIKNLLIQKSKEFYGWECEIELIKWRAVVDVNSQKWGARSKLPSIENTSGLEFEIVHRLWIPDNALVVPTHTKYTSPTLFSRSYHSGFKVVSHRGRQCNESVWDSAYIFVSFDKFPGIKESYEQYLSKCYTFHKAALDMTTTANNLAHKYCTTTQSVVDLEKVLKQKKAEVEEIQRRIHAAKQDNYSKFFKFFVETCPSPSYELKPEYEEFNRMVF